MMRGRRAAVVLVSLHIDSCVFVEAPARGAAKGSNLTEGTHT
jgi:hypothetical protein